MVGCTCCEYNCTALIDKRCDHMKSENNTYYLVHTSAMPEVLEKTVQVNEMLSGEKPRQFMKLWIKLVLVEVPITNIATMFFRFMKWEKGELLPFH